MMPDIKATTRALRYTIKMFETHSMINISCNDYFTDMLKDALDVIEDQSRTILQLNKTKSDTVGRVKVMPDREKVIKALELCFNPTGKCRECPYDELGATPNCTKALGKDVLALLKEQ